MRVWAFDGDRAHNLLKVLKGVFDLPKFILKVLMWNYLMRWMSFSPLPSYPDRLSVYSPSHLVLKLMVTADRCPGDASLQLRAQCFHSAWNWARRDHWQGSSRIWITSLPGAAGKLQKEEWLQYARH